tara:strand:+ start:171098 stop:171445 length:348 start_codon:yes stop_codon:yes gene_type:complete
MAKRAGVDWPTLDHIRDSVNLFRAEFDSVAAGLGFIRAIDPTEADRLGLPHSKDWYLNAREVRIGGDDRVGVLATAEQTILFGQFLETTGLPDAQFLTLAMTPRPFDPATVQGTA